jgi:hypothetical protein
LDDDDGDTYYASLAEEEVVALHDYSSYLLP